MRAVKLIDKERVASLLKYEVSKGGSRESAPGFNTPPLFIAKGTDDDKLSVAKDVKVLSGRLKRPPKSDSPDERRSAIDNIIARCSSGWTDKAEALEKCLGKAVDAVSGLLGTAAGTDREVIAPLAAVLIRAKYLTTEVDPISWAPFGPIIVRLRSHGLALAGW